MKNKYFFALILGLIVLISPALAHVEDGPSLPETVAKTSFSIVAVGGFLILFFTVLGIIKPNASEGYKMFLFVMISLISLGVTFYLAASTVYVNTKSDTGGPVHWHADFKIFACGEEQRLVEPTGLSNRIGRTDLHEHGDKRVHVEGVVVKKSDVSLHEFFKVIGGSLDYGEITFPGRDGFKSFVNGELCQEGEDARPGMLQVFLYKTEGDTIVQRKLNDYPEYVLSGHSQIPPGDCIIFEFSPEQKEKTKEICDFTSIAINQGKYKYQE